MTLNMQYLAYWTVIKACKQELICKNNIIENSKCIPHQYKVGDKVMLENHHVRHVPDLGDAVPYWAVTFWMTDRLSMFFTMKNPLLFR